MHRSMISLKAAAALRRGYLILFVFLAGGVLSLCAAAVRAQTDSDDPLDPQAVEILQKASDFLAAQEAMSVDWMVSHDVIVDGREKLTELRSGHNLLAREHGYYAFVESPDDAREYYFDGGSFYIVDLDENAFVLTPFSGAFQDLVERIRTEYDIRLPVWQLMTPSPAAELLEQAEAAAYLGEVPIFGRVAHHLAFSSYERDWQVWVDTDADRPEIMMIVGTDPYSQGWPQFRVYFFNWDFTPEIDDNSFVYVPDETAERMFWPKQGDGAETSEDAGGEQGAGDGAGVDEPEQDEGSETGGDDQ